MDSPNISMDTDSLTSRGEQSHLGKNNTLQFTAQEWAAQQAKHDDDTSSVSSQVSESSAGDYTIYNRKGRRITELMSEEIALDAAEAAESFATNAADATIAAHAAASKAAKANEATSTAATVAATLTAEQRDLTDTDASNAAS
jgi:hypothetical protein